MTDPLRIIRDHGGLAATHELYAAGLNRYSLAAAVRGRRIRRVRQGWFCAPGTDRALLAAARVGGRATCRTALTLSGVWTASDTRLHVAVPAHAVRLRSATSPLLRRSDGHGAGVVVHWGDPPSGGRLIVPPARALAHLARCGTADEVAAAADSILRRDPAARSELRALATTLAGRLRDAVMSADGVCESGIETAVWRWLRRERIDVRRQVHIDTVGRVDFVIGRRLVVEVDGESYHTDPVRFEADRRRDARLSTLGYRVLRFSYHQVMDRPDEVHDAIRAAITRGDADE